MSEIPRLCPKCEGAMEEGFIPDRGDLDLLHTTQWHGGLADKTFWLGRKVADKRKFEVRSYRCSRCGFLESYAL